MSRRFAAAGWALPLAAVVLALSPVTSLPAQSGGEPETLVVQERYSDDQIDNLVGPVALYPDALLAQVLVASTFPDQIEEAARYVRINGTDGIDDQPWDVSVRAVAHYLPALNLMAEQIDWTATLGRAYASQSGNVMESVQRLRAMADAQGNLVSNEQQEVVREVVRSETKYVIVPAQPQVIYVPTYDPYYVYSRPIFRASYRTPYWSFGVGFPIGSWLIYDFNWGLGSVYYNGWDRAYFAYAGGWRARSYPFVHITNVYITPRHRTVYVNRNVWRRPVNYGNVNRYASVHRTVRFGGPNDGRGYDGRGVDRNGRGNAGTVANNGRNGGNRVADARNGGNDRVSTARSRAVGNNNSQERVIRTRDAVSAANRSASTSSAERIARTREALSAGSASARSGSVNRGGSTGSRGVQTESVNRASVTRGNANRASVVRGSADAVISRGGSATSAPSRSPGASSRSPSNNGSSGRTTRAAQPTRSSQPARPAPSMQPSQRQPTRSQPTRSQPAPSQPARTQPVRSQPMRTQPMRSEPVRSQPIRSQPVRSQPVRSQPARSQPARSQPARQAAPARQPSASSRPSAPQRRAGSASGRIKPGG